jgi:hypothetical protein
MRRLGLSAQDLRADPDLEQVHVNGGDQLRLTYLFGVSGPNAICY